MKKRPARVLLVSLLAALSVSAAEVPALTISEFMASNSETLFDEDGDSSDWIEIYNSGETAVNLAGYYLTDNENFLTKWSFPAIALQGGTYVVVFASGKDRRDPQGELHTNFRLSSGGEYLALVAPDGETVVHEYYPFYPTQLQNYSYGIGQDVRTTYLLPPASELRFYIPPDGRLGRSWTGGNEPFDDTAWHEGASGVGYASSVPGFLVHNYLASTTVADLSVAEQVINDPDLRAHVYIENADVIDYHGTGSNSGHYVLNFPFPGVEPGEDIDDFVMEARGFVTIPEAGAWTFGVLSDDGFSLEVGNGTASFRIEHPGPRGPGDTLGVFRIPEPGDYELTLIMYERGGGSTCELYAARGSYGAWSSGFALVGDTARGGLAVRSAARDSGFQGAIRTDLEDLLAGENSSVYLRIPFEVIEPGDFNSLSLLVQYDDGFVAYLNGIEVARRNAPGVLAFDSRALGDRPAAEAARKEKINVSFALPALEAGRNILAVHALNDSAESDDFLFACELADIQILQGVSNYFERATPGRANASGFLNVVADTKFMPDRGFFTEPFELVITTDTPGAEIRYTLDGTVPTETHGFLYTGPILIEDTTCVRAAAFKPLYLPTNVDTHTYLFLDGVVRQDYQATRAAGFPSMWGDTSPDYGMDRRVAGQNGTDSFGGKYAATVKEDLMSIPTLSVVMKIEDMFGPGGIYTNSTRRGVAWERPCSVELIYPGGRRGFQEDCGIRIQGGAFRNHSLTKKHSLRLLFKGIYGATKLRFPLFGPGAPDRFDTVTLRANSDDGWQWAPAGGKALYIRDSFARRTALAMGSAASREIFVHLYINGIYWGLYNAVERPDNAFSATYFGGDKEHWDAINHGQVSEGNLNGWKALLQSVRNGVSSNAAYFALQGKNPDGSDNPDLVDYLDVENYVDYMIANLYIGNTDWPHKNYWICWNRVESSGFKFYMWDAEWSLGLRSNLNTDQVGVSEGVAEPWHFLRENQEFRLLVADRLRRYFFNGGALYVDPSAPRWDPRHPERNVPAARFKRLADTVQRAVVAESARWGDQHGTLYTRDEHWAVERDNLLRNYFPYRSQVVLDQFRHAGLYPTVEAPAFSRHGGKVPSGFTLFITAPQGTVYYTLDGSDPRLIGGAVSPAAREAGPGRTVTLVPEDATARVLVPADGSLGRTWTEVAFDDSSWRRGPLGVGYERSSGYEELIGTDVESEMYGRNRSAYIRIPFQVDDPAAFLSLKLLVKYDDGYWAYLNGRLVASRNAPDTHAWDASATADHLDAQAKVFESVDLPEAASLLRAGTNVLAIQALNVATTSSDLLMIPKLLGVEEGEDSGIVITHRTVVKARAWSEGIWSALTEALFTVPRPLDDLRITEIMYNPREEGAIDGDGFEFLEVKNAGEEPIDLTGVRFTDGIQFVFTEGTRLQPGCFLVLVADPERFRLRYPSVDIAGVYSGNLSNRGERIAVTGVDGLLLIEVTYGDREPWPAEPDGLGPSLVPVDSSSDSDPNKASWWRASSRVDGSPGAEDPPEGGFYGWQLPGDVNQDNRLDISDAVGLLRYQFSTSAVPLPCEGESAGEGGNLVIFDFNDDTGVTIADAVYLLSYLFGRGPPSPRGSTCVFVEGCPGVCTP